MLEYKYIPSSEEITGHMIIRVPSVKERLTLIKEAGINAKGANEMDTMVKLMDKVNDYVKEMDITKGDVNCKDFDSLSHYDFGMEIINEVSTILMSGIPTGKK